VVFRSRKALSLPKGFDLPDRCQCVSLDGPQLKDRSPREPEKSQIVKGEIKCMKVGKEKKNKQSIGD